MRNSLVFVALTIALFAGATNAFGHGTKAATLKENGKLVKTLKRGSYTFMISDRSSIHGFSLDGPHGFAKDFTAIPFTGTKTVTLRLKAGKYKYYCPNHESMMFGHFTVS